MKISFVLVFTGSILASFSPVQAVDVITAQPVTDINPLGDSNPSNITFSNNRLYFTATDKRGDTGIYVKKLTKGALNAADPVLNRKPTRIRNLTRRGVTKIADNFVRAFDTNVSDKIFFHVQGEGLYTTKGTPLSTIRLLKFDSLHTVEGEAFDPYVTPYYTGDTEHGLGVVGVVFAGKTAKEGVEPFVSNGKPGKRNTHIIQDINPGVNGSRPYGFLALPSGTAPDQIFFGASGPNYYQLYRTLDETAANTTEYIVSRTDDPVSNGNTRPYGMVLAGNDVIFGAGNHNNTFDTEVCLFNTTTSQASALTSTAVNPTAFSSGFGTIAYFAGTDSTYGTEPWLASSSGLSAGYRANIVSSTGSSFPYHFKQLGDQVYWIASDGSNFHLYRDESFDDPGKIVTTSDADIAIPFPGEYAGVLDSNGDGTVYFVGDDGTGQTLWKVDNSFGSDQATQVVTGQGYAIKNPSHLGVAVNLTGATSIARLYFRCSGVGTEFEGQGEELWVYQE